MTRILLIFCFFCFLCGCQTIPAQPKKEYVQETKESLTSVAESLSGKKINEEQLRAVNKDPEAQSAIHAVKQSFESARRMKYSPKTGKRYAPNVEFCPDTGVKLEWLEE